MADKTWTGTTDGDWATAGNWSPSGVPANGDRVFFTTGDVDVTTGLAQSAVTLDALFVDTGYTGDIGGDGVGANPDPLDIGCDVTRINAAGRLFLEGSTHTDVIIDGLPAGTDAAPSMFIDNTITHLYIATPSGVINVGTNGDTPHVEMFGGATCRLLIDAGSDPVDAIRCGGGTTIIARTAGAVHLASSAQLTLTGSAAVTGLLHAIDARINHQASGTIADAVLAARTIFDGSKNPAAAAEITRLTLLPGSLADLRSLATVYDVVTRIAAGGLIRHR